MALNANPKNWQFFDKNKQEIISQKRVTHLVRNGFLFEACATQATVLEALLFFFVFLAGEYKTKSKASKIKKNLRKLPFGSLIKRASDFKLLNASLLGHLKNYKDDRNLIIHHHLTELKDFDYKNFFKKGESLILDIYKKVLILFSKYQSTHPPEPNF